MSLQRLGNIPKRRHSKSTRKRSFIALHIYNEDSIRRQHMIAEDHYSTKIRSKWLTIIILKVFFKSCNIKELQYKGVKTCLADISKYKCVIFPLRDIYGLFVILTARLLVPDKLPSKQKNISNNSTFVPKMLKQTHGNFSWHSSVLPTSQTSNLSQPKISEIHYKALDVLPISKLKLNPVKCFPGRYQVKTNSCYNKFEASETDGASYQVVIDDKCHDLDSIEAITVQNSIGRSKVYMAESNRFHKTVRGVDSRIANKQIRMISDEKDNLLKLDSDFLTQTVLCQETDCMKSLLDLLNRQIQNDGNDRCMKVSMKAKHVITKPVCETECDYSEENDSYLKVYSKAEVMWEKCIYNSEEVPSANEEFIKNNLKSQSFIMPKNDWQIPLSNKIYVPDNNIQTERFIFLETPNERLVISPSLFPLKNPPLNLSTNTECNDFSIQCKGRNIYQPLPRVNNMKYIQYNPIGVLPTNYFREPSQRNPMKSVGDYFKYSKIVSNDNLHCEVEGHAYNPNVFQRQSHINRLHSGDQPLTMSPGCNSASIQNQANHSSSETKSLLIEDKSEFLYIDFDKGNHEVGGQYCIQHLTPNNSCNQKMELEKITANLVQQNNSNFCKECTIDQDLGKLFEEENSSASLLSNNPYGLNLFRRKYVLSSSKFNKKERVRRCGCSNNWTISVIPSIASDNTNYTPYYCKPPNVRVTKSLRNTAMKDVKQSVKCYNSDQIKTFPCLNEVIKKINSKQFYNEYQNIVNIFGNESRNLDKERNRSKSLKGTASDNSVGLNYLYNKTEKKGTKR